MYLKLLPVGHKRLDSITQGTIAWYGATNTAFVLVPKPRAVFHKNGGLLAYRTNPAVFLQRQFVENSPQFSSIFCAKHRLRDGFL